MDNTIVIQFNDTISGGLEHSLKAFKVRYQEPDFVHGPTVEKNLFFNKVEQMTTVKHNDTLKYTTDKVFNNASGAMIVEYTPDDGALFGPGGFVEAFSVTFTPTDLEQKLTPNALEHFTLDITPEIQVTPLVTISEKLAAEHFESEFTTTVGVTSLQVTDYAPEVDKFMVTTQLTIKVENIGTIIP